MSHRGKIRTESKKEKKEGINMARSVNVSLPAEVIERLDMESKKLGLNRSAYVSMTLNKMWQQDDVVRYMPKILDAVQTMQPKVPTE